MGKNVMIDLETWGIGPNALPVSIGAVMFNSTVPVSLDPKAEGRDPSALLDTFHCGIIPQSCQPYIDNGKMSIDASTIMWWLDDERASARREWISLEKHDISTVLVSLVTWMNAADPREIVLWGNGATFDNVILRSAIKNVLGEESVPWMFFNDRCYRTLNSMAKTFDVPIEDESFGTAHCALFDAMYQARRLQRIYERLGWQL